MHQMLIFSARLYASSVCSGGHLPKAYSGRQGREGARDGTVSLDFKAGVCVRLDTLRPFELTVQLVQGTKKPPENVSVSGGFQKALNRDPNATLSSELPESALLS